MTLLLYNIQAQRYSGSKQDIGGTGTITRHFVKTAVHNKCMANKEMKQRQRQLRTGLGEWDGNGLHRSGCKKPGFYNGDKMSQPPQRQGAWGKAVFASLNFYIIHTAPIAEFTLPALQQWPACCLQTHTFLVSPYKPLFFPTLAENVFSGTAQSVTHEKFISYLRRPPVPLRDASFSVVFCECVIFKTTCWTDAASSKK